ncbi:VOC family protein [Microtetraspora malaysiensis]|uniref:VOC family protein n=1 Tax=Microtetraspora malaysiensis TaxID=161358 RepID=UPI003D8ECAF1
MGITHLRSVGLAVPDFTAASGFLSDQWRLEETGGDREIRYFGAVGAEEPYSLRLRRADDRRIDYISFGVDTVAETERLAERLAGSGMTLASEPGKLDQLGDGYGFRFFDPNGHVVELSTNVASKEAREIAERDSTPVKISHVVLNAQDIEATAEFYVNFLGFRVSDRLTDSMIFLRCNRDHHAIALHKARHSSLNHISWELRGVDEFMRGVGRLVRAGQNLVWGPGRHGPGDNTFAYFTEPNGYVMEVTTALAQVDETTWEPAVWERKPEVSDQWGLAGPIPERAIAAMDSRPDPGLWNAPPC